MCHEFVLQAFSVYVKKLKQEVDTDTSGNNIQSCHWKCCNLEFTKLKDINRHVALRHKSDVNELKSKLLKELSSQEKEKEQRQALLPVKFSSDDYFSWLTMKSCVDDCTHADGEILLFYHYKYVDYSVHCFALVYCHQNHIGKRGLTVANPNC